MSRSFIVRIVAAVAMLSPVLSAPAFAQQTTAERGVVRIAGDLASPRGMTWDAAGTLYVAQSGTGDGAPTFGAIASVATIVRGCPVQVAGGLPSTFDPFRDVLGPQDVAILDGALYVLQGSTGSLDEMEPDQPNGIYRVEADGSLTLVADLTAWLNANPVANPPLDRNSRGEPYRMLPDDGFFWVVDSNSGEVLHVTPDGAIQRFADTSAAHHVVTAFAAAPGGGVYLGTFTPSPHADGAAEVIRVGADGALSDVWTGLTAVTGIAVAADGSLYVIESATGNETDAGMRPNSGRLIRQNGPTGFDVVAAGFNYPIDLAMGPDGGLYVSGPAYGGTDRDGWILRIDPTISDAAVDPALMADGVCPGDDATPVAGAEPTAPPPLPTPTPAPLRPVETVESSAAAPTVAPTGATAAVRIADFAFSPPKLDIAAGTTVTWTNDDTAPHTATAKGKVFDSGNLDPGASYSFAFTQPGTYD
ncbi:MAG: ScyD/ScyE family protein, partial [Thermomicrobiales bacterium]|nr:ScyD/ScyE family protein [Thermomicrobiales bacterium]